jgi:dienelactone hydrolase
VDYLATRADSDPARIGLMGISKGGMETYLASAVDPRIAVAVPVIGAQSFRWALDHDAWQWRVGTISPAVEAAPRFSSPEAYTPRHLAERILTSKTAVEGDWSVTITPGESSMVRP